MNYFAQLQREEERLIGTTMDAVNKKEIVEHVAKLNTYLATGRAPLTHASWCEMVLYCWHRVLDRIGKESKELLSAPIFAFKTSTGSYLVVETNAVGYCKSISVPKGFIPAGLDSDASLPVPVHVAAIHPCLDEESAFMMIEDLYVERALRRNSV